MAVFLINICKFNGCFKTFPSLSDLISHIEGTHIDYDPKVVEQKELAQPASLPLSYVLRFISDDARKEAPTFLSNTTNTSTNNNNSSSNANNNNSSNSNNSNNTGNGGNNAGGNAELKRKLAIKHHSYSMSSSNRSNTPTGSEMDEDEMVVTESEDSNDSWTTEEFSSEFIMRYGSRHSGGGSNGTPGNEKPFACPVPGCKKRYKNVNGIKYHSKNGHKKDGRVRKGYKCHCGKSYKTAQGLKNHALITHNTQPESVLTTQQLAHLAAAAAAAATAADSSNNSSSNNNNNAIQRSQSPSQSLGSLSPSSSNMSSSTSTSCHGSNSLSSNNAAATGGNMLQQLSNGNIVTVTNLPQQPQQQQALPQQQQQQSQSATATTTGNSNNSLMRSTLGLVSIKANNNHHHHQQILKVCKGQNRLIDIYVVSLYVLWMHESCRLSTTTPMQISYTFIEHKYSALGFKEKFFSNLRASRNATASTANGDNLAAAASDAASMGSTTGGSGSSSSGSNSSSNANANNMLSAVAAVGQMCALQNEHIHQNLYKKTIN
ncbi:myb-like protein D [Drosophila grimshawi]|uniref:myb-like protein D n=1 Tax=Drosophila grimshawi TaxID=7222 RepID=UPI001C935A72|nr:myb-like protein D [Drosophila grimshawi]